MQSVLITGANRGLGLEFARQYARQGWRVIATCRNPAAATQLRAVEGVEVRPLDVDDFAAIDGLARDLLGDPLDLLINNAGIYGPKGFALDDVDYAVWTQVMRTNVLAPLRLSQAFLPHLLAGTPGRIATLTSKMGSLGDNTSGGSYVYRSSKAALNAAMKSLALDLAPKGVWVALLHPGWVRTDMGGPGGLIDPPESVAGMRRLIDALSAQRSGRFFAYDGREIPW